MYTATTAELDSCSLGILERPRYFARQLVTPAELNLEAEYFAERIRRHNRMLHGWGVVCGAQVCRVRAAEGPGAEPWKVRVRPGFAIDGHGNEISIGSDRIFDLRSSSLVSMSGDPEGELSDPWCSDVWSERPPGRVWLAVCHKECLARPVRVQPAGCGCDDTSCEYSRWQDGYELRVLDRCPPSHQGPPPTLQDFLGEPAAGLPAVPGRPVRRPRGDRRRRRRDDHGDRQLLLPPDGRVLRERLVALRRRARLDRRRRSCSAGSPAPGQTA